MPTLKRRWTVADLDDLPDDGQRYEVVDGELLVTPSPAWRHQAAVGELFAILRDYLRTQPIGFVYLSPADIVFSPMRSVQPDVFVVPPAAGRRPEHFADVNRLLLAVEVLSPSTARADRVTKRTLYRDQGVSEYWIVDLDARTFERSTPAQARIEVLDERLEWDPDGASEPLVIDMERYFAGVLEG